MTESWEDDGLALAADRLDTPEVIVAADRAGMLRQAASSAAQVRLARTSVAGSGVLAGSGPLAGYRPRAVLVAGLGSAGTAGDLMAAICGPRCPVPVLTLRSGQLPGWAGAADLVLAVSAAGETPEVLTAAAEAGRRGCSVIGVGAEGTGLHRVTEQARGDYIPVELLVAGQRVRSRQLFWGQAVPLLEVAARLGLAAIGDDDYEQAARRMEEVAHQCRPSSESFMNPGKSLALDLAGTVPLVWGTSELALVAAARFAGQLQENAKYLALSGALPDAAHNQLGMFDGPFVPGPERLETAAAFTPLRLVLVADRGGAAPETVSDLAAQRGIGISELAMGEEPELVRLGAVIQLTDYASVYLAIASGIDPSHAAAVGDLDDRSE